MTSAVFFDFSDTLFDGMSFLQPDLLASWMHAAGEAGITPAQCRGYAMQILDFGASEEGLRLREDSDLDPGRHRHAWRHCAERSGALPRRFSEVFYELFSAGQHWQPYADTERVLQAIVGSGKQVFVLSNIGWDIRPAFEAAGLSHLISGYVLSCEIGKAKPDPAFFEHALAIAGLKASEVLMVGDNHLTDGAGAQLGILTLILPRLQPAAHERGLESVVRLLSLNGGGRYG